MVFPPRPRATKLLARSSGPHAGLLPVSHRYEGSPSALILPCLHLLFLLRIQVYQEMGRLLDKLALFRRKATNQAQSFPDRPAARSRRRLHLPAELNNATEGLPPPTVCSGNLLTEQAAARLPILCIAGLSICFHSTLQHSSFARGLLCAMSLVGWLLVAGWSARSCPGRVSARFCSVAFTPFLLCSPTLPHFRLAAGLPMPTESREGCAVLGKQACRTTCVGGFAPQPLREGHAWHTWLCRCPEPWHDLEPSPSCLSFAHTLEKAGD